MLVIQFLFFLKRQKHILRFTPVIANTKDLLTLSASVLFKIGGFSSIICSAN